MNNENPPKPNLLEQKVAKEIAEKVLSTEMPNHEWIIIDKNTLEKEFGWVFFYTTRKHWETKNPKFMVAGNGPLVVVRETRMHFFLPTSLPPSKAIEAFEKSWRKQKAGQK